MIKIAFYFIMVHSLICMNLAAQQNLSCKLTHIDTYETCRCRPENGEEVVENYLFEHCYTSNDAVNVYDIVIDVKHEATLLIKEVDSFAMDNFLLTLHIELTRPNELNPIDKESENQLDNLRNNLFDLYSLRELTIKNMNFNSKDHMWKLPEGLQYLTFQGTRYTEYNVTYLHYLERVDFTNNKLIKLPALYYPLYSLEELYLGNNPLDQVTTNDIARLCMLTTLDVRNSSFEKTERFCECERLRLFLDKVTGWTKAEHYKVFSLNHILTCKQDGKMLCTPNELDLSEAIHERENCLARKRSPPTPSHLTTSTTELQPESTSVSSVTTSTAKPGPESTTPTESTAATKPSEPSAASGPTAGQYWTFAATTLLSIIVNLVTV